jgi:hypothetical protein
MPCSKLTSGASRGEQKAALKAVRPLDAAHVFRGQYASYRSRADRDYRMSPIWPSRPPQGGRRRRLWFPQVHGCGIEIDLLYVDTAIERWERMTGKQARHATGQTFADIIPIRGGNFSG